jgi:hypothetical protein
LPDLALSPAAFAPRKESPPLRWRMLKARDMARDIV